MVGTKRTPEIRYEFPQGATFVRCDGDEGACKDPALFRVTYSKEDDSESPAGDASIDLCGFHERADEMEHEDDREMRRETKGPEGATRTKTRILFRIPEENVGALRARLEKLARRAVKLMGAPITLTEVGSVLVEELETVGRETISKGFRRSFYMRIDGPRPALAGWEFAATIQGEGGKNILRTSPKFAGTLPPRFRTIAQGCDHCRQDRQRNDTYIVRNVETQEFKQVGSSCMRDFLGHQDPRNVAAYLEMLFSLEDEMGSGESGGGHGPAQILSLAFFLSVVAEVIAANGWTSGKIARERMTASTKDQALHGIFTKKAEERVHPSPASEETAAKVIAWVRAWEGREDLSDYEWNLFVALGDDVLNLRSAGIAASAVAGWLREMERLEYAKRERKTNEWRGTIKKRETFTVSVLSIRSLKSDFGVTYLVKMLDEEGRTIVTFASRKPEIKAEWRTFPETDENGAERVSIYKAWDERTQTNSSFTVHPLTRNELVSRAVEITPGMKVTVKATIKAHDVYKDWKQTTVTRLEWLTLIEDPSEKKEEV